MRVSMGRKRGPVLRPLIVIHYRLIYLLFLIPELRKLVHFVVELLLFDDFLVSRAHQLLPVPHRRVSLLFLLRWSLWTHELTFGKFLPECQVWKLRPKVLLLVRVLKSLFKLPLKSIGVLKRVQLQLWYLRRVGFNLTLVMGAPPRRLVLLYLHSLVYYHYWGQFAGAHLVVEVIVFIVHFIWYIWDKLHLVFDDWLVPASLFLHLLRI